MRQSKLHAVPVRRALQLGLALSLAWSGAVAHAATDPKASKYFEDALVRYEKKDLDGAIIQLKNALQIDPAMLPVQVLLGKALLQNGDAPAAEVALLEALRLGVNRAEIVVPLGQAYLAQGKHKLVFEQQQFALAGLPPAVQLQLLLLRASASADLGDIPAALKAIEDARAIDPKSAAVYMGEVPIRIRSRRFAEASAAADRAVALAPDSAEAWYQKGSVLHVMGRLDDALKTYDRTLQINPGHIEVRIARAGIYADLKRDAEAGKDLDVLSKQAPGEPRAAYLRALLAERNKDTKAANAALKTVTDLIDPVPMDFIRYRPQLLMLNGLAHFGLGQREKAKQYLGAFQKVQPNSPASKLLAQIYLGERNVSAAIDVLQGYLGAQPADAQAMTLLASAYMSQGSNAKATALMQDALKGKDTPEMRTVLGMSLIRGGQSADGVSELEAVFRKSPGQAQAGLALLNIYMRSHQTAKAVAVAGSLVKHYPLNAGYSNLLGMAKGQAGDGPAAKAAFEQALKLDGTLVAAKLNLARLEIASKTYDAATARLQAILKGDDKNAEAMYELAVVAERTGKPADAQRWYEKANDISGPKELRWGLALLDFYLRTGQPDLALRTAKQLSGKAPENLLVLMAYGRAQIATGDVLGARSTLNGATRFAEYNAQQQVELALLQLAANNLDGAAYNLEKALAGQPDYLPAIALMADVELRQKQPAKSEKRAREILAKYPNSPVGYSLLGDVYRTTGQASLSVESYRRAYEMAPSTESLMRVFRTQAEQGNTKAAIQLAERWLTSHPKDALVSKAVGDAHARAGNFQAARASYEAASKLDPADSEILNNLANVLLQLGDPMAVKVAEQALAKDPANANAIDTLGWILFKNAKFDRSLTLLRDARLRMPASAAVRFHLAAVLAKAGRTVEARDELKVALQSGPSPAIAQEANRLAAELGP